MNERVKEFLKNIAGYGIILLISLAYVATAFLSLERSGKSLWQIAVDGALVFVVGVLMNRAFEFQGLMEGECDEELKREELYHSRQVDRIAPVIDRLEEWCSLKNREALKIQRTRILAERGMRYADYFDEDGMTRLFEVNRTYMENRYLRKIEKMRIRCYRKALSLHLTPLSASTLTGESSRYWDPYFLGRSKSEYAKESGRSDVLCKIFLSLAFGYFGVSLIADWSLANLIWKIFQMAVFLVMGNQKQLRSRSFVTGEFKGRIIKKRKYLEMFSVWVNRDQAEEREEVRE